MTLRDRALLPLVAWIVLGCGSRTAGLDQPRPADPDGATSADAGHDATTRCRWERAREPWGDLVPPVSLPLDASVARDVQLVSYDGGFFFVVTATSPSNAIYGRFDDAVGARPEVLRPPVAGIGEEGPARLGSTSNAAVLCSNGVVSRPDEDRFGVAFPGRCGAFVSGGDRAFAWFTDAGGARIDELVLVGLDAAVVASHPVTAAFPAELLGATFDARRERAVFLVGELRDAPSTDRFYFVGGGGAPPREVPLPLTSGFRWLTDVVVLDSGLLAAIDLADVPVVRFYDEDAAPRGEVRASIELFDRLGRPGDADLAAYDGGVLAYVSGVLIDFTSDDASLVFDESIVMAAGGYDVAVHGNHAVTAALVATSPPRLDLRHYECR